MSKVPERLMPIFVILIVAMMVIPLPGIVLDLLLAANFSVTIGMLLLTMYTKEPLEFSVALIGDDAV
mgnify:CR=1 FL=1